VLPVLLPVQHLDASAIAALPTDIDIINAAAVSDALLALLNQGASGLVVDMTGTGSATWQAFVPSSPSSGAVRPSGAPDS
jgi:hypothetical protein